MKTQAQKFSELVDRLYRDDAVNKTMLSDIFNKANPNSQEEWFEEKIEREQAEQYTIGGSFGGDITTILTMPNKDILK